MKSADDVIVMHMLKAVHGDVKKHFPRFNLKKDCWTYNYQGDNWEFHGPENFMWYGRAYNGWEARRKGWSAFLKFKKIEGYTLED